MALRAATTLRLQRTMLGPRVLTVAASAVLLGAAAPAGGPWALEGHGVQIYACQAKAAGFAWQLVGPEATLADAAGHPVIHHFAGPSWQALDGSVVVGEVVASSAGAAGSIPWLVLHARAHRGAGRMDAVSYIVRSQTQGGVAPAAGCDGAHVGVQTRVDYSATYTFFGGV